MTVISVRQDPFDWKTIVVHAKESSSLQRKFFDEITQREYSVTVHRDTSHTKLLSAWIASPKVDIQSIASANCELIVQADDEMVNI